MATYIIRNKETLEQWVAQSGKRAWAKPNHAKSAFANSYYKNKEDPLLKDFCENLGCYERLKFGDQDVYEVVEMYSTAEKRSSEIERKFKEVIENLYGKGYSIEGYHLNGELQSLDELFEENDWFLPEN